MEEILRQAARRRGVIMIRSPKGHAGARYQRHAKLVRQMVRDGLARWLSPTTARLTRHGWARLALGIMVAIGLAIPATAMAQESEWPPAFPDVGDRRVHVREVGEDRVVVGVPYNYGLGSDRQFDNILLVADWVCGLYGRSAVSITYGTNDPECDRMGRIAAESNSSCWHYHTFACGIPPE